MVVGERPDGPPGTMLTVAAGHALVEQVRTLFVPRADAAPEPD
ncbi:hypothetical protein GCM10009740_34460 [Terrabacter terrae]|uniref:Uncharacterized protein n=1 Tax=Terrabacter terrae TaxID=318434 RepID=A0ABN2UJM0_9MICO